MAASEASFDNRYRTVTDQPTNGTLHLRLDAMHERHRALTQSLAGAYKEAASVCLSRHHDAAAPILVSTSDNGARSSAQVTWAKPDSRTADAWANTTDTTEAGAYGCVIAGLEELRGLYAVRRAETGTGADYYVGPKGSCEEDVENCFRLEISGVDEGDARTVSARLTEKVQQALRGRSNLPALAGVIGFREKLLMIQDVPEEL